MRKDGSHTCKFDQRLHVSLLSCGLLRSIYMCSSSLTRTATSRRLGNIRAVVGINIDVKILRYYAVFDFRSCTTVGHTNHSLYRTKYAVFACAESAPFWTQNG